MKMKQIGMIAALFLAAAPLASATTVIDFDVDAVGGAIVAGQIIDDEYAAWGVSISANNTGGGPDLAVAFDTQNYSGGDNDLQTPSFTGTGNAAADVLGNVLIIQENGFNDNGFLNNNDPDDEAGGGQLIFDFSKDVKGMAFYLVDLELGQNDTQNYVEFFKNGSSVNKVLFSDLIGKSGIAFGDGSLNFVSASDLGGYSVFDQAVFNLKDSGAISNLAFTVVPEPATMGLMGIGMAGLALGHLRRKRQAK